MSKKFTELKKIMIRDTFIELLQKLPIQKVTVALLCKHAEISRSCFYRYYTDVYAILEEIEESNLERIQTFMRKRVVEEVAGEDDLVDLIMYFYDNRQIHKVLLDNSHTYMNRWHDLIYSVYYEHYNKTGRELSLPKQWMIEYNVGGITGIINYYITNGDTYTFDEVRNLIRQMKKLRDD